MSILFRTIVTLVMSSLLFSLGCNNTETDSDDITINISGTDVKVSYNTPKYIIYFIGDGLAMPQVNATEASLGMGGLTRGRSDVQITELELSKFNVIGQATTYAEDRYITGSAAAATALACGKKTTINTVAMNGDRTENYKSMAEMAKEKGMKVGIVSSVSIDHATPASFYAHATSRKNYKSIATQMSTCGFDYFGGGQCIAQNSIDVASLMTDAGYTICSTATAMASAAGKVWAFNQKVDNDKALHYDMDRDINDVNDMSLADFTQKGIDLMKDNKEGFFMMVEGGKIDWACHANDAVAAFYEMIAFDNAVKKAVDFYNNHKDETLIVVTGDHECGGLTIGYAGTGYKTAFEVLANQAVSYEAFDEKISAMVEKTGADSVTFAMMLDSLKVYFGLGKSDLRLTTYDTTRLEDAYNTEWTGKSSLSNHEATLAYSYFNPISITTTHILNQKAGLDWTSNEHTALPVPVFAMGEGELLFQGNYDNTDIAKNIIYIAGLE